MVAKKHSIKYGNFHLSWLLSAPNLKCFFFVRLIMFHVPGLYLFVFTCLNVALLHNDLCVQHSQINSFCTYLYNKNLVHPNTNMNFKQSWNIIIALKYYSEWVQLSMRVIKRSIMDSQSPRAPYDPTSRLLQILNGSHEQTPQLNRMSRIYPCFWQYFLWHCENDNHGHSSYPG